MAFIQINFYSESLRRNVPVNALIPDDLPKIQRKGNAYYQLPMKTLYLLPGYEGNHQDWMLSTQLQVISQAYHLAVISPGGENSFYLDRKGTGFKYGTYVGEELVNYTRHLFGLSEKREDTFIGGYSMGGYGALITGLKYPKTFSKIAALSSALILDEIEDIGPGYENEMCDYDYYHTVFGDLKNVKQSDKNPEVLAETLINEDRQIPEIYMACGREDGLIEPNRKLASYLRRKDMPLIYEESSGEHNWTFWEGYMERAVKWLMKDAVCK